MAFGLSGGAFAVEHAGAVEGGLRVGVYAAELLLAGFFLSRRESEVGIDAGVGDFGGGEDICRGFGEADEQAVLLLK